LFTVITASSTPTLYSSRCNLTQTAKQLSLRCLLRGSPTRTGAIEVGIYAPAHRNVIDVGQCLDATRISVSEILGWENCPRHVKAVSMAGSCRDVGVQYPPGPLSAPGEGECCMHTSNLAESRLPGHLVRCLGSGSGLNPSFISGGPVAWQ
jgi:hypothetical protein